jgi:hypothetical protein
MQNPPSLPLFWARRRPAILPEFVNPAENGRCGSAAKRPAPRRTHSTDRVTHSVYALIRS